jgi:hypothetical protein
MSSRSVLWHDFEAELPVTMRMSGPGDAEIFCKKRETWTEKARALDNHC